MFATELTTLEWTAIISAITFGVVQIVNAVFTGLAAFYGKQGADAAQKSVDVTVEGNEQNNAANAKQTETLETIKTDVNSQSSAAIVKTTGMENTIARVVEMTKGHPQHEEIKQLVANDKAERDQKAVEIVALAASAKAASDDEAAKAGVAK